MIDTAYYTLNTNETKTVLGSYNYELLNFNFTSPQGYHQEFVLSGIFATSANTFIRARLNNIATEWCLTWSGTGGTFRQVRCSERFKVSDIVLEPTYIFGNQGTNLYIETQGSSGFGYCYGVSVTCFLVKD